MHNIIGEIMNTNEFDNLAILDELDITVRGLQLTESIKNLIRDAVHESTDLTYNDLANIERMFARGMVNSIALAKGKCSHHRPN
jgi:hypothetical protein